MIPRKTPPKPAEQAHVCGAHKATGKAAEPSGDTARATRHRGDCAASQTNTERRTDLNDLTVTTVIAFMEALAGAGTDRTACSRGQDTTDAA